MTVFKCKMCGADIEVEEGKSTAKCAYCRTAQTLPVIKAENDDLRGLYNRANILRLKSEFDKAEEVYEKILLKDDKQSEAYWGVLLCKYGIEYVEDPASGQRVPTCHRASYEAMTADEYYKLALANADPEQRVIYEREAKYIDGVQKDILAISSTEEPYDVFICYKESDNGVRTRDSVIANDIYHQLTAEGFKVFYAAITLENKLGSQYEPVIFAALNSAKVMLAIGTKPEYLNAVWVKNEWSRYLKIIKSDRKKLLIPCYKDMDAYELPEEFAHLQAQDMGKIGFITDIIRGIKKVLESFKEKPAVNNITNVTNVTNRTTNISGGNAPAAASATAPLLERAFMFLEDGEFDNADKYAEKVLDTNPKEAEAYLVKLLVDLKVKNRNQLQKLAQPFKSNKYCEKLLRFADEDLKEEVEGYNRAIADRIKAAALAEEQRRAKELAEIFEREQAKRQAALRAEEQEKLKIAELEKQRKRIRGLQNLISDMGQFVAVKSDGKLLYSGNNAGYKSSEVLTWRDIVAVSGQYEFLIGLKSNGCVVSAGKNKFGQCNVSDWRDIVAISSSPEHTVGLKNDGTVVATGCNDSGQCNVQDWKDIKFISADSSRTFGINSNGEVFVAGFKDEKYSVAGWKDIISICYYGFVGLKRDGTLIVTGRDANTIRKGIGGWSDIVWISDCFGDSLVGLKRDGNMVWWEEFDNNTQVLPKISGWRDIVAVKEVYGGLIGLKSDGTLVATETNGPAKEIVGWKLFDSIDTIKEERIQHLKNEKAKLIEEDKNLSGLFKGKRKKEIAERLAEIEAQLK